MLQNNEIIEKTFNALISIEELIGKKWLDKRLQKIYHKNEQNKNKPLNKQRSGSYLFETKPHPLVQIIYFAKEWLNSIKKQPAILINPNIEPNEQVLKINYIAKILEESKKVKGFKKVLTRLLDSSQYESAFFEAEVAAIYHKQNFEVEFVEENNNKSPDLKVTKNGISVWVECKTRKPLSDKEEKHDAYWNQLKASLLKQLRPKKINVAIIINTFEELEQEDIDPLRKFILNSIKNGGIGSYDLKTGKVDFEYDPTRKFSLAIHFFSEADELHVGDFKAILPDKDYNLISDVEILTQRNDSMKFKNPFILMHKTISRNKNQKGVIHTFKTAIKQLPSKGPGIIWIKTLDNHSKEKFEESYNEIEMVLKKELEGHKNQSVNFVVIHNVLIEKNFLSPTYGNFKIQPIQKSINHKNPNIRL